MGQLGRILRSKSLALYLLIAIAVVVALGAVIPQRLRVDPSEYALWKLHFPSVVALAESIGLDDVYNSPVFMVLSGAFFVNLAACTWGQVGTARTRFRSRIDRLDVRRVRREAASVFVPWPESRAVSGGRVVAALSGRGYSLRSVRPGGWEGRRRWVGHLALPVFHVALVVIITGALVSALLGFRGSLELAVGQGFENRSDQYLRTGSGLLARPPGSEFALRLDGFAAEYHPSGQIAVRESRVTLFEGSQSRSALLRSSHPVSVAGYRVYQTTSFGWSAFFRVKRAAGGTGEGFVNLSDSASVDAQARTYVQSFEPPGTTVSARVELVEGAAAGETKALLSSGSDGILMGPDATLAMTMKAQGGETWAGSIAPGETIDMPGGGTLTYVDLRRWTTLTVTRTPGLWAIYAGGVLALLALLAHFTIIPERVLVAHAGVGDDGPAGYWVGGRSWRYPGGYPERLDAVARSVRIALEDGGPPPDHGEGEDPA